MTAEQSTWSPVYCLLPELLPSGKFQGQTCGQPEKLGHPVMFEIQLCGECCSVSPKYCSGKTERFEALW